MNVQVAARGAGDGTQGQGSRSSGETNGVRLRVHQDRGKTTAGTQVLIRGAGDLQRAAVAQGAVRARTEHQWNAGGGAHAAEERGTCGGTVQHQGACVNRKLSSSRGESCGTGVLQGQRAEPALRETARGTTRDGTRDGQGRVAVETTRGHTRDADRIPRSKEHWSPGRRDPDRAGQCAHRCGESWLHFQSGRAERQRASGGTKRTVVVNDHRAGVSQGHSHIGFLDGTVDGGRKDKHTAGVVVVSNGSSGARHVAHQDQVLQISREDGRRHRGVDRAQIGNGTRIGDAPACHTCGANPSCSPGKDHVVADGVVAVG